MYKVAIIISTVSARNLFRSAVISAYSAPHLTNFLICSGFFHERTNSKGPFYASDAFLRARTSFPIGSSITTVGAYNPSSVEYDAFVQALRTNLRNSAGRPLRVRQRYAVLKWRKKWHAKIFIAAEKRTPRFAIIGSSNLTRSAFAAIPENNESDVIIWDDAHVPTKVVMNGAIESLQATPEGGGANHIVIANYDPSDHRNSSRLPMEQRLAKLWRDIVSVTV